MPIPPAPGAHLLTEPSPASEPPTSPPSSDDSTPTNSHGVMSGGIYESPLAIVYLEADPSRLFGGAIVPLTPA